MPIDRKHLGRAYGPYAFSVGLQHEILPRVAVDVNYSRRSWGNHFFTDNRALTPADFADQKLPGSIDGHRPRLFGLTILPERLREIREERRPGSRYASIENCRYEVREAEAMMQREGIPMIDTTSKSIEEIATTILHRAKVERHVY